MKFIYVDESGDTGHSDFFVMAGLMVDAYKLRKKTEDFDKLVQEFFEKHPEHPKEIKTSRLINGKGRWNKISPDERKKFISDICNLAVSNGGKIYGSAMHLPTFIENIKDKSLPFGKDKWIAAAMYISCLIQKKMESVKGHKGLTVFVMDHNHRCMPSLSDGLYKGDSWYDGLYQIRKKIRGKQTWQERTVTNRFDQIVNTAFAIKSEHSTLVQVADVISYVYRRNFELQNSEEAYKGEADLYKAWISKLEKNRENLGQTAPCEALEFYKNIAPDGWKL